MPSTTHERGAAAVEFALVLPVLLVLVLGIIDFGRAFSAQQTLTNAARVGSRVMALQNSQSAAISAAQSAASPVGSLPSSAFTISPSSCSSGAQVTFTVNYTLVGTGFFGNFPMTGQGVMLCGG
ncbi:MAG: pilus assembly protein [Sinomonas sp.]|nr:pilus assembly protein [Sinomonas sp.]